MIFLKNCRLIPELSGGLDYERACVEIRNGKITAISGADTGATADESCRTEIDCRGMTLMPGIIDLHVHLSTAGCGVVRAYTNDQELVRDACKSAQKFAEHGVTTMRDMGSTNAVAVTVRDMIRDGSLAGPRIFTSGHIIVPAGLVPMDKNTAYHSISGAEEMKRAVREEVGESVADVVKIYASGSAYKPGGEPDRAILTRGEITAAVDMAGFLGKKVAAHCHSAVAIKNCIEAGVYTIEHASYIDLESIEAVAAKPERCYLVPTMAVYSYVPGSNPDEEFDRWSFEMRSALGRKIAPHIREAYEAGLELGFGTDTADGNYLTNGVGAEFRLRKELCGMRNIDILRQATSTSAKILGIENETGQVRVGFAADLILVRGEPDRDISAMYEKPVLTICSGRVAAVNI